MTGVIISNAHGWKITSYGNGMAYLVEHSTADGTSSFAVQGDDAARFRSELEAFDLAYPNEGTREFMAHSGYDLLMSDRE